MGKAIVWQQEPGLHPSCHDRTIPSGEGNIWSELRIQPHLEIHIVILVRRNLAPQKQGSIEIIMIRAQHRTWANMCGGCVLNVLEYKPYDWLFPSPRPSVWKLWRGFLTKITIICKSWGFWAPSFWAERGHHYSTLICWLRGEGNGGSKIERNDRLHKAIRTHIYSILACDGHSCIVW